MIPERDVKLDDGRVLRVHDGGGSGDVIVWHHGSPHTGRILPPVLAAAAKHDLRVVSYARPAYGGSTPNPGRSVASSGHDVEQIVDALGIDRFAVAGYSGGGPHALATAAFLPDRVSAVVTFASVAPFSGDDWFTGMADDGALRAARESRAARAVFAETDEFNPEIFVDTDWAALSGPWSGLGSDSEAASGFGPGGLIDDDRAFTTPWGFDPDSIAAPTLLVQGESDRVIPAAHGQALAARIPGAELWLRPGDGHVAVLGALDAALDWMLAHRTP